MMGHHGRIFKMGTKSGSGHAGVAAFDAAVDDRLAAGSHMDNLFVKGRDLFREMMEVSIEYRG